MDYKPIIESRYNRQNWQNLLHDIFQNRIQFWADPFRVDINNDTAKCAYYLGKIQLADGKALAIYEVSLSDSVIIERNKVSIRNLLVSHWKSNGFAGAFMFCFKQNESVLRFSYVSEILAFNADGKLGTEATDTKRFTYYLGEGHRSRTAIERFTKLKNSTQTLDDVTDAFSVEALTKEFYNKLYNWYLWAVDDATGVTFPNKPSTADDDREGINVKIIRMITRLLFVWFVKQKNLVPEKLFDEQYLKSVLKGFDPKSRTVGNYYNAILQNLFFATLNRAIIDDEGNPRRFAMLKDKRDLRNLYRYAEMFSVSEDEVLKLFERVPFLNGGLFECLDKFAISDILQETDKYFDGFSRNDSKFANGSYKFRAFVPNVLFFNDDETHLGLINLLKQYNFTIEENSPNDVQVSLDPELLGRVFENLLASYNPETQESARNATGSFYTPREIVDYMVDESIVAHLKRKCPTIQETDIRSLFASGSVPESFSVDDCEQLSQAMLDMKILDPACGSGAFPMGCLLRLVNVIEVLQPEKFSRYDLKIKIIENCIYGVDIQPIAMMICKLRFFISLICEQNDIDFNAPEKNFGINTLPNLETKFVAANTLIGVKKRAEQLDLFENPDIDATKQQLITIRKQHFYAKNTYQKRKLRDDDKNLREKLAALLRENHNYAPEDARQFAQWNPYDQNAVSPFFSPEWMFGIENGFDVVIGNPPYIQLQSNGGALGELYAPCGYETFVRTGDIYSLFYERGWQLLKEHGHLCFITSNKWMRAGYGEKTRSFFANKTNPIQLIDFAGVKVFESATVDTNILLFAKEKNKGETLCAVAKGETKESLQNMSVFVLQKGMECGFVGDASWVILSPIEQSIKKKIESIGTPLKDWNIQINYGIKTGFNDAFIISTEKRNEILANCQSEEERERTAELIRPILRGRDIKRYGYNWAGLWLINTHNGIKGKIPPIDINDYPAVKQHLDLYWDRISTRDDKGVTPYNLRNCAYMDLFFQPKICWKAVGRNLAFSIVDSGVFLTAPASFIFADNVNEYLLAFLCSNVGKYFIYQNSDTTGAGDIMLNIQSLVKFPVPESTVDSLNEINAAVEKIIETHSLEIQHKLDLIIYNLYGFNELEIKTLENIL